MADHFIKDIIDKQKEVTVPSKLLKQAIYEYIDDNSEFVTGHKRLLLMGIVNIISVFDAINLEQLEAINSTLMNALSLSGMDVKKGDDTISSAIFDIFSNASAKNSQNNQRS